MAARETGAGDARQTLMNRAQKGFGVSFIGEVIAELRRVIWPTREEATRLTSMVIIVALVVGVALGMIDIGFSTLIRKLF